MTVIAYAYDGSDAADHALDRTSGLVAGQEAVVICTWAPDPEYSPAADQKGIPYSFAERVEIAGRLSGPQLELAARETAEVAASQLRTRAERVTIATPDAHGDPARAIADEASKVGADALVVGTRARSRFARLLDGGVTSALIERSTVPVVVVQQRDESHIGRPAQR